MVGVVSLTELSLSSLVCNEFLQSWLHCKVLKGLYYGVMPIILFFFLFQRTMGRSPIGTNPTTTGYYVREERYSCVSAMGIEGVLTTHTIPKAFSTEDFIFALEHFILPHVGRFALGESHSVVVMDNARIHDSVEGIRMIRERGGLVVFLP